VKIGFDISQTGTNKAGCGYFAHGLINSLAKTDNLNQYILYPTFGDSYWDPEWREKVVKIDRANFSSGFGHANPEEMRCFWSALSQDSEKLIGNPDIIHANNFFFPKGPRTARVVYTLYDLGFLAYPECTTEENRLACFNGVYNASLYADYIVSISEFSLRHFLRVFPHFPHNRISVLYGGSRFSIMEDIQGSNERLLFKKKQFWLNVSTLEPRKNHLTLLKGYSLLQKQYGNTFPLVLVGMKGWHVSVEKMIAELGLDSYVEILGYVDDSTLRWLYQNCFAFVFPSLFEGFGLPVLEAMSMGVPVIVSATSSLPEIVGNNGMLVDPNSTEEICDAMHKLQTSEDLYHSQRQFMSERAERFSWQKAARRLLEIYEFVLSELPPRSG